jgi:hypothetical protein
MTLWPAFRAIRVSERPKPEEQPVINQTRGLEDILLEMMTRRVDTDSRISYLQYFGNFETQTGVYIYRRQSGGSAEGQTELGVKVRFGLRCAVTYEYFSGILNK